MAKIFIETMGCTLNQSDTEVIKGILTEKKEHTIVNKEEEAELIIINSCTVKSSPEQRLFYKIRNKTKPMIIAGCVPIADPKNKHFEKISLIGPKTLSQIKKVVEETLKGRVIKKLGNEDKNRNQMQHIQTQKNIEIIPINAGCKSNCTYCKTKAARGELESYPIKNIEKQFRESINNNVKEIWLTSQDTGAYGLDINLDITKLLERLLEKPGEYMIRLGMTNPQHIKPRINEIIKVFKHKNMFKFLHIPLQSGSNKVLNAMKRGYTKETFKEIIKKIRKEIPEITIATDVITGFPNETEEDYKETEELIKELKIPVVNISKFYPRPETKAANMKLTPTHIVKNRSTRLKKVCEEIAKERNKKQIGKEMKILIDEKGKKPKTMIGRTENYIQTIIKEDEGKIGETIIRKIKTAGIFDIKTF